MGEINRAPDIGQLGGHRWPPSIAEFGRLLRTGAFSARDAAQHALELAAASQDRINAFIAITADLALHQAEAVDASLAAGRDQGPLMGVPVAVKDVFDVEGVPTTAGSKLFADRLARSDAAAVSRLADAGAVIVGKTNMDQFAFGPHQDDYGRTNCPADTARYAGGSSGGSAAAVAEGIVLGALGSDAGGSTRFPAACCGVVGFKPSFGRVPTAGIFPTFPSLDHVGLIGRALGDVQELFGALSDTKGGQPEPVPRTPRISFLHGWRDGCSQTVVDSVEAAIARLVMEGTDVNEDAKIDGLEDTGQLLIATVGPEARVELEAYLKASPSVFPTGLRDLLDAAENQPATEYIVAQIRRSELQRRVEDVLSAVDAVAMPTSLDVAWRWAEIDAEDMGFRDKSTLYLPLANLTGHPAVSLPAPTDGLPVGLQLIGARNRDESLIELAARLEQALR